MNVCITKYSIKDNWVDLLSFMYTRHSCGFCGYTIIVTSIVNSSHIVSQYLIFQTNKLYLQGNCVVSILIKHKRLYLGSAKP